MKPGTTGFAKWTRVDTKTNNEKKTNFKTIPYTSKDLLFHHKDTAGWFPSFLPL